MSMTYDPPVTAEPGYAPRFGEPGYAPPYTPWPGSAGPGGPGGPTGYGGGGDGPGKPVRRFRLRLLVVGAVAAIAGAAIAGLTQPGASTALTTAQVAAKVDPALVDINTNLGFQQARAAGTGQVLTSNGLVLTNNHVIRGATSISVTDIGNGHTYRATVLGYDQSHDVALLRLSGASGLQTITTGNSSSAAVGQKVVALGNAEGRGGTPSVAQGRITSLNASITASDASAGTAERLTGLIHHNAPIQPGDSGGPLVNTAGQVVGVNTAASAGFEFQSNGTQAFAIPINQALSIVDQIKAHQASATVHIGATGLLGVQVMSAGDAAANGVAPGSGAAVAGVISGSPAARAGLSAGDVIVAAGGHRIKGPTALQNVLIPHHPGDRVSVTWAGQAGQTHTGTLTLMTGPPA